MSKEWKGISKKKQIKLKKKTRDGTKPHGQIA